MTVFRFAIVGGLGFMLDAGVTWLLISSGVSPYAARPPAIVVAMGCTWILNRTFTFRAKQARTAAELVRYGAVASFTAILSYLLYAGFVMLGLHPMASVALATAIQASISFLAYRAYVFPKG